MANENPQRDWDGRELRELSQERVTAIVRSAVDESLKSHKAEVTRHIDESMRELKAYIATGYPDGDPVGHRLSHEKEIRGAARWEQIKTSVAEKLLTGGVWGLLAFLGLAAWEMLKREAQK